MSDLPWWLLALGVMAGIVLFLWFGHFQGRSVKAWLFEIGSRPTALPTPETVAPPTSAEPQQAMPVGSDLRWQRYAIEHINHDDLLAADETIAGMTKTMLNDSAPWAVAVTGEGGIGKTALTYEAVKKLSEAQRFDRIIWASAKDTTLRIDNSPADSLQLIDWQDVERKIAEQLGLQLGPRDLLNRWIKERIERSLRYWSNEHASPPLIIIIGSLGIGFLGPAILVVAIVHATPSIAPSAAQDAPTSVATPARDIREMFSQ